jgi:hypothetical protein
MKTPAFRIHLPRFRSVEFETEDLEHPPFSPFPSVEIVRFGFFEQKQTEERKELRARLLLTLER